MNSKTEREEKARHRKPNWNRKMIVRFTIVFLMAATGAGMMAGGLLAWVVGEEILLLTGVTAGAIFVAAGGLGFLRCLDTGMTK